MLNMKSKMLMTAIIPIALIICLSAASFAATPFSASSTTRQSIAGVVYEVSDGFTATSNGFLFAAPAIVASSTWTPASTLTAGVSANHWYYSVTLTAKTGATAGTVSIQWSQNGASYTALGTAVTFSGTPTLGDVVTFLFDTGVGVNPAVITAPVAIVVTVS